MKEEERIIKFLENVACGNYDDLGHLGEEADYLWRINKCKKKKQ